MGASTPAKLQLDALMAVTRERFDGVGRYPGLALDTHLQAGNHMP
jgi:hypothetical protein